MKNNNRPISPHLSIYKPQITSILSISHRMSGIFQSLGLLIIVLLLFSLFLGKNSHEFFMLFINSFIGKAFLFFYVLSLCYHLFNGIRHIIWDIGFGFEIKNVYYSGIIVIIFAVTLALYILVK
tara:strand:- start:49 stop:420 length:372 start_codon:yes stop_codon:yes gene_type:complete